MRKGILMGLWLVLSAVASAEAPMGVSSRPGETTFRVWAPRARSVEVVGDFNGWNASAAERLVADPASGLWTATLLRSRPSGAYRFLINGKLPRRDPYARAVTPDGQSSLFYDPAAFAWEDDRPPAIPIEDLVLYEMHVGAYHDPRPQDGQPGTFYDAIKRLDHLVELGVSAVCLMPVHEFSGQHSWGYNPCDLFAVEQAYGGPDGLKSFVKACHRAGIAVHLDVVHNHYGPDNLDLANFDGPGSPYFYQRPELAQTPWGPRVNFDEPMVRRFIRDNIFMWLEEYRVDGFRWDSPSNIRAAHFGALAIPAGAQMLEDINSQIRARFPQVISIGEDSMDIGNFHGSWDFEFHHQVMSVLAARTDAERDVGALSWTLEWRPETMARVVYADNHDEAGKINRQTRIASDVDPANPASDYARRMCGLGAVLTLTAPGIPLLLMGNEFQESGPFHDDRPLDWGKRQRHAGLFRLHRDLIRLRRNLDGRGDALKGMEIRCPVVDRKNNLLVYWRWHAGAPTRPVIVVLNVSKGVLTNAPVVFPSAGPWDTLVDTEWARYGGGIRQEIVRPILADRATGLAPMTLPPYSARIFALTPGGAAPAAPAAVELESSIKRPPLSLYSGVFLTASFNQGSPTALPMKLVRDYLWECRTEFQNAGDVELKIAAKDSSLFWGAADNWPVPIPYRGTLKRRGQPVRVEGTLHGAYRIRFNEHTEELSLDPAAEGEAPVVRPFRTWTSAGGSRVQARFVSLENNRVILEQPDGQRLQVPLDKLSAPDQVYLQTLLDMR